MVDVFDAVAQNTDPPLKYAFFDPGKANGYAIFDASGRVRFFGQVELNHELTRFLKALPDTITHIIYEDYIIRPGVNHSGSRGPAMLAIGKITGYAELQELKCYKQQPSIKSIGYTRLKMRAPSDHSKSHQFDALAHGEYWIWKNRIREEWKSEKDSTEQHG